MLSRGNVGTKRSSQISRERAAFELELERRRAFQELSIQRFLIFFACCTLGLSCVVTLALFCFQGFHVGGFQLDNNLMHWIGGVTVGSIAALAATVYGAFFRKERVIKSSGRRRVLCSGSHMLFRLGRRYRGPSWARWKQPASSNRPLPRTHPVRF
jgi:hypothetical protein